MIRNIYNMPAQAAIVFFLIDWTVIDYVILNPSIEADGKLICRDGDYLFQ